jgi:hypothetical protein
VKHQYDRTAPREDTRLAAGEAAGQAELVALVR